MDEAYDAPGEFRSAKLEVLEGRASSPGFNSRWRAFMKDCVSQLLSDLPPEARQWVALAEQFDAGTFDESGLTTARLEALRFVRAHQDAVLPRVLSGMEAAVHLLWPPETPVHWYDSARLFMDRCEEAGLTEEKWWPLLQVRFF